MKTTLYPLVGGAIAALSAQTSLAAPTVYIPLGSANEILVVDAQSDRVVREIGGLVNPHGLAATPDGRILVAGRNQERPTATLPDRPAGMSEREHRGHHAAPVGKRPDAAGRSQVDIIDARSGKVIQSVDVTGAVHHNLVMPSGRYAISTHTTAGGISVIDLESRKLVRTVATGRVPNYVVTTRNGRRLYVSNAGSNTISEIDTRDWTVTRNIPAGPGPEHLVLAPDERTLYVANVVDGTASAVSLKEGKVVKTYQVGRGPHGLDLSPDGKTLFATSQREGRLVAIDLETDVRRDLALDPAPYHVTTIGNTGKIYVSSRALPKIWVVDQKALKVTGEIPVKGEGHQMAVVN